MEIVFSETSKKQLGSGSLQFQWQPESAQFLAVSGENRVLVLMDRRGQILHRFPVSGLCTDLQWDPHGELLVALNDLNSQVVLWDINNRKVPSGFDVGWKGGLSRCRWSPSGDQLAIVNNKGNLLLFNRKLGKKIPIMGKHTRAIVDLMWANEETLICAAEDQQVSISNSSGDTVAMIPVPGIPSQLQVHRLQWTKNDVNSEETAVSVVINQTMLYVLDIKKEKPPIELNLPTKYGNLVAYCWAKPDVVVTLFSTGVLLSLSITSQEQDSIQLREYRNIGSYMDLCQLSGKIATCGDGSVKIHEIAELKDLVCVMNFDQHRDQLDRLRWSDDGQFLTVSTKTGDIYTLLGQLPHLADAHGKSLAVLSSLREVKVADFSDAATLISKQTLVDFPAEFTSLKLEVEPTLLSLGSENVAVAAHHQAWAYSVNSQNLLLQRDFMGAIKALGVNTSYLAALVDGRVFLSALDGISVDVTVPDTDHKPNIQCFSLTNEFLITGSQKGYIHYYIPGQTNAAVDYHHDCGIMKLYANQKGNRVAFIDQQRRAFLLFPLQNVCLLLRTVAPPTKILWNADTVTGRETLAVCSEGAITVFACQPDGIHGPEVIEIVSQEFFTSSQSMALTFIKDVALFYTANSRISAVPLAPTTSNNISFDAMKKLYLTGDSIALKNLMAKCSDSKILDQFGKFLIQSLDINAASLVYRQLCNNLMLLAIDDIKNEDDKNLFFGKVSVILGEINQAQDFFLNSSQPIHALRLRTDLLQWEQALSLAKRLAPKEIPLISLQYAQYLESNGKATEALEMFKQSLVSLQEIQNSDQKSYTEGKAREMQMAAQAGYTRCTFRLGDIARGMKLLQTNQEQKVFAECASILETIKQYSEAAFLYEKAKQFEKAAELYIRTKNYTKVGALLPYFKTSRILVQYAKAKENEGNYEEAAKGYEKAEDFDNLCRVYIQHLHKIDEAVALARRTKSRESAKIIAKFFQSVKDYRAVVEFCLMADMKEDAFMLAKANDVVEYYAELIQENASLDELKSIALYFDQHDQFFQAGKYFALSGDVEKALQMYTRLPTDSHALEAAVSLAAKTRSDNVISALVSYLIGEFDGHPKDARYILKLYLELGRFVDAAKTAVIIASEEQAAGNYRGAREILVECYKRLRGANLKVSAEMEQLLVTLHSYLLIKSLIKLNNHEAGARLLIRVSNNISKFPSHAVAILTSTVIECHMSGLKKSAFDYASVLCRPEYRNQIDPKFKRKIELIVRRPEHEEVDESRSPCPFCQFSVPDYQLECSNCKNTLPFCIASGSHMVADDWCSCPHCMFPARLSRLQPLLELTNSCPLCEKTLAISQVNIRSVKSVEPPVAIHSESLAMQLETQLPKSKIGFVELKNDEQPIEEAIPRFRATAPVFYSKQ